MPAETSSTRSELEGELANLRRALESRTEIGIALGILAERYGCTSSQSWTLLTRLSSHTNIKVVQIAHALVSSADGRADEQDAATLCTLAAHLPRRTSTRPGSPARSTDRDGQRVDGHARPLAMALHRAPTRD